MILLKWISENLILDIWNRITSTVKYYWLVEQRVAVTIEWAAHSWGRLATLEQQACTGSSNTWQRAAVAKGFLAALLRLHACQEWSAPSLYCVWFVFPKVIVFSIPHLLQTPLDTSQNVISRLRRNFRERILYFLVLRGLETCISSWPDV